eukprot:CAMPEP_0183746096 /NCGR_PEP_ID=MMETSP0737-20130205/66577_1 /TAXON_ID=385413 /ORGANISM="Thalassiosira miniscula, Strain CCMP1093" /LENGTH=782 /DNA_ID=CAMNT_0025981777 /DNA_START=50 /DNA_END=2398 /DNA_ORIENTATION=-
MSIESCPNPCPRGFTGFKTRPGSRCKQYVSCTNGEVAEEMECFGDTVFNPGVKYCDWASSYSCDPSVVKCPDPDDVEPSSLPAVAIAVPIAVPVPANPDVITIPINIGEIESSDCPNPCPWNYSGLQTTPGSDCQKYVNCKDGYPTEHFRCFADNFFSEEIGACMNIGGMEAGWTCPQKSCPTPAPAESNPIAINIPINTPITIPINIEEDESSDCPNPCKPNNSGLQTKPGTNCKKIVNCVNGAVTDEFECYADNFFSKESGACLNIRDMGDGWICPSVPCPTPQLNLPQPVENAPPTLQPTPLLPNMRSTNWPTPRPTRRPLSPAQKPTSASAPTYQYLRTYLLEKEDAINSVVLQSNGSPSTTYTFSDFMNSMDMAVFQFPADKAFFVGEGTGARFQRKLTGVEYGLVNIGLFLSNAMEEGIKIDSCDEWNTDFMYDNLREKYPLSNACGQYGRSYEDEECHQMEPFQCPLNTTLELTAVVGNTYMNVPPFTCRARIFDGANEIFPGYYDVADDVVIKSPYANTLGRTDVEGCCYWGRGVLLTRGRCTIGKLDKYVGKGATDRGIYLYDDVDFCTNPEAICNHHRSNELRWLLGMLEWSDRVQSYANLNSDWRYMDELKRFVDGGMVDEEFINGVINIFTRKCHDESCDDQWYLDEENNVFKESRIDNFRKIIFEIFNLPLTYNPTKSPSETPYPTLYPSSNPVVFQLSTKQPIIQFSLQPNTQPLAQPYKPTVTYSPTTITEATDTEETPQTSSGRSCCGLLFPCALSILILLLWTQE